MSLQPDGVNLWFLKLRLRDPPTTKLSVCFVLLCSDCSILTENIVTVNGEHGSY